MTLTDHIVNLLMEANAPEDKPELTEEIQRIVDEANLLTVAEVEKMGTDKAMVVIILKAAELYARSKWDEACEAQRSAIAKHLTKWVDKERNHDELLYPASHIPSAPKPKFRT